VDDPGALDGAGQPVRFYVHSDSAHPAATRQEAWFECAAANRASMLLWLEQLLGEARARIHELRCAAVEPPSTWM
jgi:hypothetical protein